MVINTKLNNYENQILQILKKKKISLICLAGYMKIISNNFIKKYGKKIINIHPSLLPKFKGLNTFVRVLKNNEKKTGCTVHYVNEKLDSGHIILQKSFYINSNDNEKTLKQKTQKLEYQVFPEAIIRMYRNN
jgi:formyltetrahydrofolate-dependent phosphoribosylglycinamide formyltransferase